MITVYTSRCGESGVECHYFSGKPSELKNFVSRLLGDIELQENYMWRPLIYFHHRGVRVAVAVDDDGFNNSAPTRTKIKKSKVLELINRLSELKAAKALLRGGMKHYLTDAMINEIAMVFAVELED